MADSSFCDGTLTAGFGGGELTGAGAGGDGDAEPMVIRGVAPVLQWPDGDGVGELMENRLGRPTDANSALLVLTRFV